MKIDWKQKLSSRKFWAMIAVIVTSILTLVNVGDDTVTKVAAVVTAFGAAIAYIFAEASVDKSRTNNTEEILDENFEE